MNLNFDLSPDAHRIFVIGACVAVLGLTWTTVGDSLKEIRYQPVYGESLGEVVAPVSARTLNLPVVEASAVIKQPITIDADDLLIESAFSKREEVPEVDEKDESPPVPTRPTASQILVMSYKPSVQGLGAGGVFIDGQFWSVGEKILSMPVPGELGNLIYPRIVSISSREVKLSIGNDSVVLPVKGML